MPSPERRLKPVDGHGARRKLAAILSADVAGYSRLMGADEIGTHGTLIGHRQVMDELIARHEGRVVGTAGDSMLADFPSVVEALSAAVDIQSALSERNAELPAEARLEFRIGINLGDVIVDGDDIFGDGVNVAARVQALAEPGGIAVSGNVYEQVSNKLRLDYRDRGSHTVKNIAAPVRVYSIGSTGGGAAVPKKFGRVRAWSLVGGLALFLAAGATAAWLAKPPWLGLGTPERPAVEQGVADAVEGEMPPRPQSAARPTIAVLPFDNLSDEPEQDYFSEGVTADIIAALGRFSNLTVLARTAVLAYRDRPADLEALSRELNARYLVEGSVRKIGDRVRVTAQLSDGGRGTLLWSHRYDESMEDIFSVQDAIVKSIVGALAIRLTRLEQERALAKPTENLEAYDYVLRGRERLARRTRAATVEAEGYFERAIELDPRYAEAYVGLGRVQLYNFWYGWSEWPAKALEQVQNLAQQALTLKPASAEGHSLLGLAYLYEHQHDRAVLEAERALELNPNDAPGHRAHGMIMLYNGQPEEAIRSLETAARFDPDIETEFFGGSLGFAYYLVGRYDDAIRTMERGLSRYPNDPFQHIALAAAYGAAGRLDQATREAENVRRLQPFFDADSFGHLFRKAADRERIVEGLRKAGLGS